MVHDARFGAGVGAGDDGGFDVGFDVASMVGMKMFNHLTFLMILCILAHHIGSGAVHTSPDVG